MKRRQLLMRGGSLVLLLTARDIAFGATIVAVRVWPAEDYTRVTIESDALLAARHFVTGNPQRLVIDVEGLELSPALRELVGKVKSDDPYIQGVRVGQNLPRVVRLVFDLKQAITPQVFTLEPVAAYQHRLVFDLHPVHERDPLLALIQEKAAADQARERFEFRNFRHEREKEEKAARLAAKAAETRAKLAGGGAAEAPATAAAEDPKKALIAAALARAQAQKAAVQPKNTDELSPEKQAEIAEIEARRAAKTAGRSAAGEAVPAGSSDPPRT